MPPLVIAAAITGGAAIAGSAISSSAAKKAAQTSANAATQADQVQTDIYNKNSANLTPAITTGDQARSTLSGILGIGGDPAASATAFQNYLNSTGYQFTVDQGNKAITSSKAASGALDSGATLKAEQKYGQNEAQQYVGNYEGQLGALSQEGTAAGGALAGVGTGYAGAVGSNITNAATTTANAGLAAAGQTNNALAGGLGALGQYLGNQQIASSYTPPAPQTLPEGVPY